ncbi:MAG TPA: macro domain-containing protein [Actinomycetota bacterium]|jgi:O-acetyl-ADP-ribose deacetylase (regulator of RNase III)|nr:macro domain-containing protein [Actinomycetota bacterium]
MTAAGGAATRTFGSLVVECAQGDITSQPDVDAVVNAANAELAPGGGVAGAIHRVAGPGLYEECRPLAPLRTGQAVITSGHGLPNPWCIHVLGPVYRSSADPPGELASCYREMCARAEERKLRSLATPAVSTGIFGYPVEEAADVALQALHKHANTLRSLQVVRFVLWGKEDFDAHVEALQRAG